MARLPQRGRWQLVDPRLTMGLLGGDPPPFGILEMDLGAKTGSCRWWVHESSLTHVVVTPPDQFAARYAIRSFAGAFTAKLRDDGELELDFYQGTPKLKCRAVFPGETQWQVGRMALLTAVGNGSGRLTNGPGHSALIVDNEVWTFEDFPRVDGSTSGWIVSPTTLYLGKPLNLSRPIIIQELSPSAVNFSKAMDYIQRSTWADEDYIGSGVCSQQSAAALAVAVTGGFDPRGVNTPRAVHDLAKSRGLASKTYYIWDTNKTPPADVSVLVSELSRYYYGVKPTTGQDVRTW